MWEKNLGLKFEFSLIIRNWEEEGKDVEKSLRGGCGDWGVRLGYFLRLMGGEF